MLVWISKGIIDIRQDVTGLLEEDSTSGPQYYIKIIESFNTTSYSVLEYSSARDRDEDLQVLKDCLVHIKSRNNVLLYNPPTGVSGDRGSVRPRSSGEIPF